jgi:hypothetical protein
MGNARKEELESNPRGHRSKLSKFLLKKFTMPIRKWGKGR